MHLKIDRKLLALSSLIVMTAAAQAQVGLWTRAFSFGVSTTERAVDIVTDGAGNVYSVGTTGSDVLVVSYTQQGTFRWSNTFVGAGGGLDTPTEAVTDAAGNLYVVGTGSKTPNLQALMVLKFTGATGALAWSRLYSEIDPTLGEVSGPGKGICMGPTGSLFVTGGILVNNEFQDALTLKLSDATGAVLANDSLGTGVWPGSFQYGEDIAFDGTNIFVAGSTQDNPAPMSADGSNMLLVKYNSNLVEQWHTEFDGHGKGDFGINLAVRPLFSSVFVYGNASTDPVSTPEMFMVRADSNTGAEVWRRFRTTKSDSRTGKMALDSYGYLTATANLDLTASITKRVRAQDGGDVWERIIDNAQFTDIAVDVSSNTYLIGTATAKLDNNSAVRWQNPQAGVAGTVGPTHIFYTTYASFADLQTVRWYQSSYSLSLSPSSTPGGYNVTGTVTSSSTAPVGGLSFDITESSDLVTPPGSVTIPAGSTSANFTIATSAVSGTSNVVVPITASLFGVTAVATLTLMPPTLASVSVTPDTVTGGTSTLGKVTLTGISAAGGKLVSLRDNSVFCDTPASVLVGGGNASKTFTILTTTPSSTQTVTITASLDGVTQTTTLTINP